MTVAIKEGAGHDAVAQRTGDPGRHLRHWRGGFGRGDPGEADGSAELFGRAGHARQTRSQGRRKHKEKGLRYVYSPTTPRKTARKSALRKLVDVFFEGSKEQVVTALLDGEKWSEDELDALAQQIAARQKERSGR